MNESEFNQTIDDLLADLEEQIDDSGVDIDYENVGGVLTLKFENDSQIIINRQTPVRQLWLAAKSGGFHFDYDAGTGGWKRDSDGADFYAVLTETATAQAGEPVEFSAP